MLDQAAQGFDSGELPFVVDLKLSSAIEEFNVFCLNLSEVIC